MGTKSQLCKQISSITGIEEHILKGGNLEDICVAKRMSWASNRKTTRSEDVTYCLLGIFNVNLPLICGEGRKAFLRLQHEIMRSTTDQSLFAWGTMVESLPGRACQSEIFGLKAIDWMPPERRKPLLGLLAESPISFRSCGQYSRMRSSSPFILHQKKLSMPNLVDNGVMAPFVVLPSGESFFAAHYWDRPQITQVRIQEVAILFCHSGPDERFAVGLPLRRWGDDSYARTQELVYAKISNLGSIGAIFRHGLRTMHIKALRHFELQHGDIVFRRHFTELNNSYYPGKGIQYRIGHRIIQTNGRNEGGLFAQAFDNGVDSFAVVLRRIAFEGGTVGSLCVGAIRSFSKESLGLERKKGLKRIKGNEAVDKSPTYHHTMATPLDTWVLEIKDLPRVYVRSQRMPLGDGSNSFVDVVDLLIPSNKAWLDRMTSEWNQNSGQDGRRRNNRVES